MKPQANAKKTKRVGIVQKLLGWFLTFFNGFFVLMLSIVAQNQALISEEKALLFFFVFMTVLGIILIFRGQYNTKQAKRMTRPAPAAPQAPIDLTAPAPVSAPKYTTVQCPNCGAPNKIAAGTAGPCEYCGSPVEG